MQGALVSIHDVMPETLGDVITLVDQLETRGLTPVTLLIVPGREWTPAAIGRLHHWQQRGHQLAGHGWWHRAAPAERLGHRVHAAILSRACGEHLSLTGADILALMRRNHRWFAEHDLAPPELYVPPAWALGRVSRAALQDQPFAQIETLGGIYDVHADRLRRLPLLGFEADTAMRAAALRIWNSCAAHGSHPRIAIHPADLHLRLRGHLARSLDRIASTRTYAQWRRSLNS